MNTVLKVRRPLGRSVAVRRMATAPPPPTAHGRPCAGGVRVIGAGLGRTGTTSLTAAFEILGYKPLHYIRPAHAARWAAFAEGRATADDVLDLVVRDGFDVTLDGPWSDLYAEQLRRFPNAKVVLSVRDDGAQFERSWRALFDTVGLTDRPFSPRFPSFFQWIPLFRHVKAMRRWMGTHLGLPPAALTSGFRDQPPGWLAAQYEAHNAQVRAAVPPERLLVFNVKEGWGPLCAFLGADVPDRPFPKANEAAVMRRLRVVLLGVIYGWIPAVLLLAAYLAERCRAGGAVGGAEERESKWRITYVPA